MIRFNFKMKNLCSLFILCVISFLGNTDLYSQDIWTAENSPYYINSDTIVSNLKIEAGVEVLFIDNYSFTVDGEFQAIGAQYDSIYFKPAPGNLNGWKGINFNSSSTGIKLDFCSISGGSSHGISVNTGKVFINNTVVFNNSGRGLSATSGEITVVNSVSKGNGSYGLYLGSNAKANVYSLRICKNNNHGVNSTGGTLIAYNSIFDHNTGFGLNTNDGTFILENVVVAYNSIGLVSGTGKVNISNSIFFHNSTNSVTSLPDSTSISYSDIEIPSGVVSGIGNKNEVPQFVDDDFKLSINSPCLDYGNPGMLYNDIYYPPSQKTSRNDMGAYGGPFA